MLLAPGSVPLCGQERAGTPSRNPGPPPHRRQEGRYLGQPQCPRVTFAERWSWVGARTRTPALECGTPQLPGSGLLKCISFILGFIYFEGVREGETEKESCCVCQFSQGSECQYCASLEPGAWGFVLVSATFEQGPRPWRPSQEC